LTRRIMMRRTMMVGIYFRTSSLPAWKLPVLLFWLRRSCAWLPLLYDRWRCYWQMTGRCLSSRYLCYCLSLLASMFVLYGIYQLLALTPNPKSSRDAKLALYFLLHLVEMRCSFCQVECKREWEKPEIKAYFCYFQILNEDAWNSQAQSSPRSWLYTKT